MFLLNQMNLIDRSVKLQECALHIKRRVLVEKSEKKSLFNLLAIKNVGLFVLITGFKLLPQITVLTTSSPLFPLLIE